MYRVIPILVFLLLCPSFCCAWSGTVIRITDGDTLIVQTTEGQKIRIRLYGIDCPEGGQPYGREATTFVHSMVIDRQVEIEEVEQDRYRRTVAIVRLPDGVTLQEHLLASGAAWVFPRYCTRQGCMLWEKLERTAKELQTGLWAASHPVSPWKWRQEKRRRHSPGLAYDNP